MSDTYFLVVGLILSAFGILSILGGFFAHKNSREPVDADITKLTDKTSYHRGITTHHFTLTLKYLVDGKSYETKVSESTRNGKKYHAGETIGILIDPKHPERALLKKTAAPFLFGLLILIPGAILVWCYFL